MSTTVIEDSSLSDILDSESEVRKLQELVKKLQLQNQLLLHRQSQTSDDGDVENFKNELQQHCDNVDANFNTSNDCDTNGGSGGGQCAKLTAGNHCSSNGILREQQLNTTNCRLSSKVTTEDCRSDAVGRTQRGQSDEAREPCKANKATVTAPAAEKNTLDVVNLIDVDGISLDEEDSWLGGKSPKQQGTECTFSPYNWLREDFDRPSPELLSARRSLVTKLDEVTRLSQFDLPKKLVQKFEAAKKVDARRDVIDVLDHGDVTEVIAVPPTGRNASGGVLSMTLPSPRRSRTSGLSVTTSEQTTGGQSSPKLIGQRRVSVASDHIISSGTSIGITADHRAWEATRSSDNLDGVFAPVTAAGEVDVESRRPVLLGEETLSKRSSASEENLLSSGYRLNDVMDVKQLARMQEESLRLSYNAPLVMSKKGLSKSLNRSSGELAAEDNHETLVLSNGLNRSSGSLLSTPSSTSQPRDVATVPKLDITARVTSRSAGNLLNSQLDASNRRTSLQPPSLSTSVTANRHNPRLNTSLQNGISPPSKSVTAPGLGASERAATGLRTPRSGLRRLQAASKQGARSTSLHAPRSHDSSGGPMAVTAVAASSQSQLSRLTLAVRPSTNSLPNSPHSSDQDLDQPVPSNVDPVTISSNPQTAAYRQSLPNLARTGSKLSLALSSHASDLQLDAEHRQQSQRQPEPSTGRSMLRQPAGGRGTSTQHAQSPTRASPPSARYPPSPTGDVAGALRRHRNIPSPTRVNTAVPRHPQSSLTQEAKQATTLGPNRLLDGSTARPTTTSRPNRSLDGAAAKSNEASRQPSRLVAPSRSRLPSPSSRRNLVSTAISANDDSWKDGCF
jgi:hypothetical protein